MEPRDPAEPPIWQQRDEQRAPEHDQNPPQPSQQPYSSTEQYGSSQPYGQPQQYGWPQPYGQAQQYGPSQPYVPAQQYGWPQPYGQAQQYGPSQPYVPAQQYGSPQPYGQPQQYGSPQPYGQPQPYVQPRPYGSPQPYGSPSYPLTSQPGKAGNARKIGIGAAVLVILAIVIGGVAALRGARTGGLSHAKVEKTIEDQSQVRENQFNEIKNLKCNNGQDMKVKSGAKYTCTGDAGAQVTVTVTNAASNPKWEWARTG